MRTVVIVNQATGVEVAGFEEYVDAAVYRRDVLMPTVAPDEPCPYAIRGVPR
ncbi:putative uncharacterized protein [Mycolicibacterium canariasense]|uniref:Uncharacterized protein n=1 Tax=Mycolicibacterium canariasense TaxID=228230 RepID=A0A100WIK5_MYCCR|nr:hypothetical protein [Mycolicibacterium canariasense]MCV7210190.1 hypothetical protein [Mycolicibacterium canariasense]GAS98846.1 putative uncharacterized protein [Mycolicibacterium canariasense]